MLSLFDFMPTCIKYLNLGVFRYIPWHTRNLFRSRPKNIKVKSLNDKCMKAFSSKAVQKKYSPTKVIFPKVNHENKHALNREDNLRCIICDPMAFFVFKMYLIFVLKLDLIFFHPQNSEIFKYNRFKLWKKNNF